jgi:hypothetical protein
MFKLSHRFFQTMLNEDVEDIQMFLLNLYKEMEAGVHFALTKGWATEDNNYFSAPTMYVDKYNLLSMPYEPFRKIKSGIKDLVMQACDYYKIDFDKEDFMVHAWFNINWNFNTALLSENDMHDSLGGRGIPDFHGYYSVNAEPSTTRYFIGSEEVDIQNKNNRILMSETGYMHGVDKFDWWGERTTISFEVTPRKNLIADPTKDNWIKL